MLCILHYTLVHFFFFIFFFFFFYFFFFFFFFNDTATTEIYTLSLHDALPICSSLSLREEDSSLRSGSTRLRQLLHGRSEEHTSELQSPCNLVCRLLLEKKKKNTMIHDHTQINYISNLIGHKIILIEVANAMVN